MATKQRLTTIALAALLLIGCAVALIYPSPAAAIPLEQTTAPEATPYVNPFFTPVATTCPTSFGFGAGDIVVLTGGVVIRYEPNPSAPFIVTFPENRLFTVLEGGPMCVEGINWYPITGHGVTGWVSEGTRDGLRYWLRLVRRAGEPEVPCLTPLNLVEGNRFAMNVNVRMRAQPSTAALTLTVVPYTATVNVLEGPVCNEGINWWYVRATVVDFVYEGWMAESSRGGTEFVNVPRPRPCHSPLRLDIGEQARVIYNDENPKRLRDAPTVRGNIITELIENVPLVIIGGPVCADSYNWWNVRVLASTPFEGWLAEGGPANYWIAPVSEFR
jgi:hypothetical protein